MGSTFTDEGFATWYDDLALLRTNVVTGCPLCQHLSLFDLQAFPRFHFLSDANLLAILGAANSSIGTTSSTNSELQHQHAGVAVVRPHLRSLFPAVADVIVSTAAVSGGGTTSSRASTRKARDSTGSTGTSSRDAFFITGVISVDGEVLTLQSPVSLSGSPEAWLGRLEAEIKRTLHQGIKEAVFSYPHAADRAEWLASHFSQIGLIASRIWFCWSVEDALQKVASGSDIRALRRLSDQLTSQRAEVVVQLQDRALPPLSRSKLSAVLLSDSACLHTVDRLLDESVTDASHWAWHSQLRHYWDREADDVIVMQAGNSFRYGHELTSLPPSSIGSIGTDGSSSLLAIAQALSGTSSSAAAGCLLTGSAAAGCVIAASTAMGQPCFTLHCGHPALDASATAAFLAGACRLGGWALLGEWHFSRL